MYWTYLYGTVNSKINILTLESNEDLNKLIEGSCSLIQDDFFSSFGSDFDQLFISEYNPIEDPNNKEKKFKIKFNELDIATQYLNNITKK